MKSRASFEHWGPFSFDDPIDFRVRMRCSKRGNRRDRVQNVAQRRQAHDEVTLFSITHPGHSLRRGAILQNPANRVS